LSNCGATYNEIQRRTKIIYDPCITRESNQYNINYIPNGGSDDERIEGASFFSNLLTSELQLWKLPLYGSLEERRIRLKQHLMVEQQLHIILQAV
jgi:hypothetical protein